MLVVSWQRMAERPRDRERERGGGEKGRGREKERERESTRLTQKDVGIDRAQPSDIAPQRERERERERTAMQEKGETDLER